jgi:uncharacterized protein (TIGR00255 family)
MTGYGQAATDSGRSGSSVRMTVEIRSVNHRGFDLKLRSDQPDGFCDAEIARAVRGRIERGTVAVSIREERSAAGSLNVGRIREIYAALERIRSEIGIVQPVDLGTVAAFLSTSDGSSGNPLRGETMWRVLQPAVEAALTELVATRTTEGQALRADLVARLAVVAKIVDAIELGVKPIPSRFARRLEERLAALRDAPGFDPGRAAQEVALMAERLDVSEELVRLRTHLEHFRGLMDQDIPVGRKLDFVIQEIGREINTIGSKAQDAAVAAHVIDGKAELEKIREQAQNIE